MVTKISKNQIMRLLLPWRPDHQKSGKRDRNSSCSTFYFMSLIHEVKGFGTQGKALSPLFLPFSLVFAPNLPFSQPLVNIFPFPSHPWSHFQLAVTLFPLKLHRFVCDLLSKCLVDADKFARSIDKIISNNLLPVHQLFTEFCCSWLY